MDVKGKLFKESLEKIQLSFRLSGIPLHSSEKFTTKLRILFFIHFFAIATGVGGAFHFFCIGVANGEDFTKLTFMAPCMCYSLLSNAKAFTMILNRRKIGELIDSLTEMEEKTKKFIDGMYLDERVSLHKFIFYFNGVYLILLVTFLLAPLAVMTLKYFDGDFELIYPFSISYPFDPFRVVLYPVVYLHQVETIIVVIIFTSSADYFFYTCCLYISIQFKLLQLQFEKIIPNRICFNKTTYTDIKDKFIELIGWHQKLISLTTKLEIVYAKSTLYNFVSSSILICLTLFDVTAIKDIAFVIPFLFFLGMCLVQIYLLCYFGDKVTQASAEVSSAIYNSLWYLSDATIGKHLLLVQMRAQKPCKLTALGFADVNQRAFMRILSNAWSFFALLNTMYR